MKEVYTLTDLASRDLLDAGADLPAKLAVIGHPIAHSASPQMHLPNLLSYNMPFRYVRIDLAPDEFEAGIRRLQELDFIGCNVTIPHKAAAFAVADEASADAQKLKVANTLAFGNGRICATSTDGPGFSKAIFDHFAVSLSDLKILILGAGGGAGLSIALQCALEGCQALYLVNRSLEKLDGFDHLLLDAANEDFPGTLDAENLKILAADDPQLLALAQKADLIVNATSLGLKDNDVLPLPAEALRADHLVYDAIYKKTPLLEVATSQGAQVADGRRMLLHQGALSFEWWFDRPALLPFMETALEDAFDARS